MRRHTLFLLQGYDTQVGTLETMTEWSAAELLHPVSFLDLDQLDRDLTVRDLEHRVLVDGDLAEPVRLLDWLTGNFCDLLRLVTLHTATKPGQEHDGVRKAERVREDLNAWLGAQQQLLSIACFLVDPVEAKLDPRSVLPTWAANLVISPTDQALPAGAAAPVPARLPGGDPNPQFAAIATQNLCTVGGAWRFLESGPLDAAAPHSQAAGVQVLRSFVRLVDMADPTTKVTTEALSRRGGTGNGWPLPAATPGFVEGGAHFAAEAAELFGDRHRAELDGVPFTPTPPKPLTSIGLLPALRLFARFLVTRAVDAPRAALALTVAAASTAASNLATISIFGRSSGFQVEVGRPLRPNADIDEVQRAVEAAIRIADPTTTYMPPVTRELWQEYLRVGIGLVDGTAMPPTQRRPQIGDARVVITDPAEVAVRPDHPGLTVPRRALDQPADAKLTAEDPLGVLLVQDELRRRLLAVDPAATATAAGGNAGDVATPASGDADVADDSAADGAGSDEDAEQASNAAKERAMAERSAREQLEKVEEWIKSTREPYTWRIGMRIAVHLRDAEIGLLEAVKVLQSVQPTAPGGTAVRNKRVFIPMLVGVLVAVAAVVAGQFDLIGPRWTVVFAVAAVVAGIVVGVRNFIGDIRRRFQALHAYDSGVNALNEATRAFRHFAQEVLRLNSVYWQYRQWTVVLANVLHQPFAGEGSPDEVDPPTLASGTPKATRAATAEPDERKLDIVINDVRRRIFTMGWAYRCWEAGRDEILEDFRATQALDDGADPFDENLRQKTGALDYLCAGFRHGAHGRPARRQPEEVARDLIVDAPLRTLTEVVLVDGTTPYPDPGAPAGNDPADGLFDEIVLTERAGQFAAELWAGRGLRAPIDVRSSVVATLPGRSVSAGPDTRVLHTVPVRRGGHLLFAALRVDLSEPCAPPELVMFEEAPRPVAAPRPPSGTDEFGGD